MEDEAKQQLHNRGRFRRLRKDVTELEITIIAVSMLALLIGRD